LSINIIWLIKLEKGEEWSKWHAWGEKIEVYLKGIGQEILEWIFLAQDGEHRKAVVGTVTKVI